MKKIIKIILLVLVLFTSDFAFAAEAQKEDNIIIEAFSERKARLLDLINWWKLETEISKLKTKLEQVKVWNNLTESAKTKLLNDITNLEQEVISINNEIKLNVENSEEFDLLLEKYNNEIKIKKDLVDELNNSIKENEINTEKIDLLLDRYIAEKAKLEETENKQKTVKIYIFIVFTLISLLIYLIARDFSKKWKLDSKKWIYINFFLLFIYIIFLIWFFFYLYPQLSIFLIFISWYMLIINSHLIWSFIWSVVVLQRFKIWDIIKFWDVYWQISKISPLYIVLLPLTREWVFKNKPVYVPHINILKENVTKDITADTFIHKFEITIRDDSWIEIMKFLEDIENNILTKFLHNKLDSITDTNDFYRISFDRTNFGHIVVVFVWRWDDILNKKVERKIIWFFSKSLIDIKKEKEKIEEEKLLLTK